MVLHVPEYDGCTLLDPAALDENLRLKAERIYEGATGRAVALSSFFKGKPKVVFHPGGQSPSERDFKDPEARYEALGKTVAAMKKAAGDKVDILIENLPRTCCFFSGSWKANIVTMGEELAELAGRFGIGCTLDICHLFLGCQEDKGHFLEEIEAALPRTEHIHYSDARGTDGEGIQIGEGDLPIEAAFEVLEKAGKDIHAVPEIWFGHEDGGAPFARAWDLLGKRLGQKPIAAGVAG